MTVNARQKGKRGERAFIKALVKLHPEIKSNRADQAAEGGLDALNTGDVDYEFKTGKQCKLATLDKWRKQLKAEGNDQHFHVLACKPDYQDPYVVMDFEDYIVLMWFFLYPGGDRVKVRTRPNGKVTDLYYKPGHAICTCIHERTWMEGDAFPPEGQACRECVTAEVPNDHKD